MPITLKAVLVTASLLTPAGAAVALDNDSAPTNLVGKDFLQFAQGGGSGSGGAGGGSAVGSGVGAGSSGASGMGSGPTGVGSGSAGTGAGTTGRGTMGLGDASKGPSGSNGLNPRMGPGSSPNPSSTPADDMAKTRDEETRLHRKQPATP